MSDETLVWITRPSDNYVCFQSPKTKKVHLIKINYSKVTNLNICELNEFIDFLRECSNEV